MLGMALFVLCLFIAFLAICITLTLAPHDFLKRQRVLICPETRQPADVKVDIGGRIRTLLSGRERLSLKACARWPERSDCRQDCLLQVDSDPKMLAEVVRSWYAGSCCAVCGQSLAEEDWQRGHYSALDEEGHFLATSEIPVSDLPMVIGRYRPVCWTCHLAKVSGREPQTFRGDRRAHHDEVWAGE